MSLANPFTRAPYSVRDNSQAVIVDRDGHPVLGVIDPPDDPKERIRIAQAHVAQMNAAAAREAADRPALPQAAE